MAKRVGEGQESESKRACGPSVTPFPSMNPHKEVSPPVADQEEEEDVNPLEGVPVGSRLELKWTIDHDDKETDMWWAGTLKASLDNTMNVADDDGSDAVELPLHLFEYDARPDLNEMETSQEEICFWHDHKAMVENVDNEDCIKLAWWRIEGSSWEPKGSTLEDFTENPIEASSPREIEALLNNILETIFADNALKTRLSSMPRDQQCWLIDTVTSGRELVVAKMKDHLEAKAKENPGIKLTEDDLMAVLDEVKNEIGHALENGGTSPLRG